MKLKIYALIAAAAMSWCCATHAAEVSVSVSEGEYPTSNTVEFDVALFDSSLGQLKSVQLFLEVTANSSERMRGSFFLPLVDPTVKVTDVTDSVVPDSDGWETVFFIPPGPSRGVAPNQFFIEMYKLIDDSDQPSLDLFQRERPTSAPGLFSLFNVKDPDSRISLAGFNFTVAYTYLDVTPDVSAVPVPASAWLMGTGVLAMGAFLRRRRGDRNALAF
jgi:hypothetical protein